MKPKEVNKKRMKSSVIFIVIALVTVFIGSNVCCTGKVSNSNIVISQENSGGVKLLNESTFDENIKSGVTLVDFWAPWCKPCKMQGPIIEEVSKEMQGKANICKLDIDESNSIARKYGIQSIPTLLIFKDGALVGSFVGVTNKQDIIEALNKLIK